MNEHQHTTWDEQIIWALSILFRGFCIVAAGYIFFGKTYLPGCDVEALAGDQPVKAFVPLGVITVATAYFTIYGSNWTPNVGKYESIDAFLLAVLGLAVFGGVFANYGAMNDAMTFTAWMLGTLVVLGIALDWIGRLSKWAHLRRQAKAAPAGTP